MSINFCAWDVELLHKVDNDAERGLELGFCDGLLAAPAGSGSASSRQRNGNGSEIRVLGVVSPFDANATVTISDANTGAVLGTVPLAAPDIGGDGEFQLRLRDLTTVPTRVRAVSSNGGEHEADVELR